MKVTLGGGRRTQSSAPISHRFHSCRSISCIQIRQKREMDANRQGKLMRVHTAKNGPSYVRPVFLEIWDRFHQTSLFAYHQERYASEVAREEE